MRKVIAAINMSLDGIFDHTAINPDDEIHTHYANIINDGGTILYGRITYELMEYWRGILENPSDEKSMNDFAIAIDKIPKIVFSNTMKSVDWQSAKIANNDLKEVVLELKKQEGNDILIGSRSLIIQLLHLNLIDELQVCIHPIVVGNGLTLFEHNFESINLQLLKTKTFKSGAIMAYYRPILKS